jgi:hypothetical protein
MHKKQPKKKKQSKKSKAANTSGTKNERIKQRAQFAVSKGAEILILKDDDATIQRGLYSDEILPKLEQLAAQGLNNQDIATALCIGNRTFYEWKERYPQFAHSLAKYRGVADIMVENSLYKSAVGYDFIEEQVTPKGRVVALTKHAMPNASSIKLYLINRMSHRYKNKVETQLTMAQDISQMAFVIKRREE